MRSDSILPAQSILRGRPTFRCLPYLSEIEKSFIYFFKCLSSYVIKQNVPDVSEAMCVSVFTANISGAGALQRNPVMPHTSASQAQAINLKIQNPINLRLTNQQVNLLQHSAKSGTSLLNPRPLLINASHLRPLQPQGGIPLMHALPQQPAPGQLVQPNSVTLLPQGAKLAGNPLHGPNLHLASGKVPIRSLHRQTSASGSAPYRNLPNILQKGSSASVPKPGPSGLHQTGQGIQVRPITPISAHSKSTLHLQPKPHSKSAHLKSPVPGASGAMMRMPSAQQLQNEQMEATDLSKKPADAAAGSSSQPSTSTAAEREQRLRDQLRADSRSNQSAATATSSAAVTSSLDDKTEIELVAAGDKDKSITFDVESSLQWKDGVGTLPGADLKVRVQICVSAETVKLYRVCTSAL